MCIENSLIVVHSIVLFFQMITLNVAILFVIENKNFHPKISEDIIARKFFTTFCGFLPDGVPMPCSKLEI